MNLPNERGDPSVKTAFCYKEDQLEHIGTVPNPIPDKQIEIPMSRHHVISWGIIRDAWNRAHSSENEYVQERLYKLFSGEAGNFKHRSSATVAKEVCWSNRNLIVGPATNNRLFDPGDDIDFEIPISMSGPKKKHVEAMVALGKLLITYAQDGDNDSWLKRFKTALLDCVTVEDICSYVPTEWTLMEKTVLTWHVAHTGGHEITNTVHGKWHRGGFAPATVKKHYKEEMTPAQKREALAKIKKKMYDNFVKKLPH